MKSPERPQHRLHRVEPDQWAQHLVAETEAARERTERLIAERASRRSANAALIYAAHVNALLRMPPPE